MFIIDIKDVYNERRSAKKQQANIGIGNFLTAKQKKKGHAAWQIVIDYYDDLIDSARQTSRLKNKKIKENFDDDCNAGIIFPEKINIIDYEIITQK